LDPFNVANDKVAWLDGVAFLPKTTYEAPAVVRPLDLLFYWEKRIIRKCIYASLFM